MNIPDVSYARKARVNDRDFTEDCEEKSRTTSGTRVEEGRLVGDYENLDVKHTDNL